MIANHVNDQGRPDGRLSTYQRWVIGLLAFLQFTIVLDFMIMSPLGAILIPVLKITPAQFGMSVSVYAFAAGTSGVLAAGFADRFDRKKLLLFFYGGFVLGTLLCGLAHNYSSLLLGRLVTGAFAGVVGSCVFAITTDLFSYGQRGRVMGILQTAFAASNVLGIPAGLYLATTWSWNTAFLLIVAIGAPVGLVIARFLKPIDQHLRLHPDRSPIHHLLHTFSVRRYLQGFLTTAMLVTGGFALMPYASAFSVHNLGIPLSKLPLVYMVTGLCSIVAGPLIGRASDAIGKLPIFYVGCTLTIVMVSIYTHLGVTPLGWVILINSLLYVGVSSRMIASSALISAIPAAADRGAYMSISSSIQQIAGGLAAIVGGLIVSEDTSGRLVHFEQVGYLLIATTLITSVLMYFINRRIEASRAHPAPTERSS
jgi:predicted MFS family arabinose efflux permease